MLVTCTFCRIIRGELQSYIIADTDQVIVFLSKENHPLVVSKQHIPNIYTLDDSTGAAIIQMAGQVARALKAALACDGVYLTQANEPAAGQDVFHFHMHVYPRWHSVEFQSQQTSAGVTAQDRDELFQRILAVWEQ